MKKSILVALLLMICTNSQAQSVNPALLEAVKSTYAAISSLQFGFVQKTYIASIEKEIIKQGVGSFVKPGQFKIDYTGDHARQYISNGKKMWVYQKGDGQVMVVNVGTKVIAPEALDALASFDHIDRDFNVESCTAGELSMLKIDAASIKQLQWLKLIPKNPKSQFETVIVGFDPKTKLAALTVLMGKSGNLTRYVFTDLKTNAPIDTALFNFKQEGIKEIKKSLLEE